MVLRTSEESFRTNSEYLEQRMIQVQELGATIKKKSSELSQAYEQAKREKEESMGVVRKERDAALRMATLQKEEIVRQIRAERLEFDRVKEEGVLLIEQAEKDQKRIEEEEVRVRRLLDSDKARLAQERRALEEQRTHYVESQRRHVEIETNATQEVKELKSKAIHRFCLGAACLLLASFD